MWQVEDELREKNRSLISQLIEKQSTASRIISSSAALHRRLDALQKKLDSLESRPSRGPKVLNESDSLMRANSNNNNLCQQSSPELPSPRRELLRDLSPSSPVKSTDVSAPPVTLNVDDLQRDEEVKVIRASPEANRSVRRKLIQESSRLQSPLRDSTNSGKRTPRQTEKFSLDTPKSILKHRQMIDKNVRVESKFCHTPGWMDRAKRTRFRKKSPKPLPSTAAARRVRRLPSAPGQRLADDSMLKQVSFTADPGVPDMATLKISEGNWRNKANVAVTPNKMADSPDSDNMPTPQSLSDARPSPALTCSRSSVHMLGYDWIAALLDHSADESQLTDKHESYFRELREFRRLHRDECQNDAIALPAGKEHLSYIHPEQIIGPRPDPPSPSHTCIHGYTVNDRLYAEPIHSDTAGNSRCAVCSKKKQTPPTAESPAFVRVSIPRSTLLSPYKIKPHRRKSFNPSDSVALSRHCLAGWVHPHPIKLPVGKNVDLANETNRLKSKFTMTLAEAEELARKSKASPIKSRDLAQTTLYSREVKKITNQLLDTSNAIKFQSQLVKKTSLR